MQNDLILMGPSGIPNKEVLNMKSLNGREEHDLQTENTILSKLKNQPKIVSQYYMSMVSKTAKTKQTYINYLLNFFDYLKEDDYCICAEDMKKITKLDIDQYLEHIKYRKVGSRLVRNSKSIIRTRFFAVKSFFEFLVDNELIDKNPCDKVKLPAVNKEINIVSLTQDEIEIIKSRIIDDDTENMERDLAIFVLGIRTGLRVASIMEINISDINFDDNSIIVTEKGDRTREVYFGEDTKQILLSWIRKRGKIKTTDALFVSNRGERISYIVPSTILKKYCYGFNKKITPHKLRSTCASGLYEETGDIYLVADVLGHRNIDNTRRYAGVSVAKKKSAAEFLDNL